MEVILIFPYQLWKSRTKETRNRLLDDISQIGDVPLEPLWLSNGTAEVPSGKETVMRKRIDKTPPAVSVFEGGQLCCCILLPCGVMLNGAVILLFLYVFVSVSLKRLVSLHDYFDNTHVP